MDPETLGVPQKIQDNSRRQMSVTRLVEEGNCCYVSLLGCSLEKNRRSQQIIIERNDRTQSGAAVGLFKSLSDFLTSQTRPANEFFLS